LEVTKTHVSKAPEHWRRKQTVAGGERFTCDELDALADKVAHAQEQKQAREAELYGELTSRVGAAANRLRALGHTLAEVDVAAALAEVAHRYDYCRPSIDTSRALEIRDGRHPVVERLAAEGRFVPNDIVLGEAEDGSAATLWLVTGPNMAGKSTIMRQAALIVLLAQAGSFVPAASARIGLVDRILTRVGASDNVARGESTFMVEMKETAHVLRHATARSLVVLDEIGRGTSTYDGLSIAWAVAEYLHDTVGCRALFATHYHELTKLSDTRPTLANVSVSAREHDGHIVFLHKLEYGAASRSYGVACAKLAGVPEPVLERAGALLRELERQRDDNAQMPNVDGAGTSRTRKAAPSPQLSLFGGSPLPEGHLRALETLREVDPNTLTPLDALTLLARLRSLVHPA
jgi:DNA mismatch repair protein MutS